jgi:hypothetical protein
MMSTDKKSNKNKRNKDVIYPIFKKCCDLLRDEFWIKLFDDLSKGKCPKGVMIYNGFISSTHKRNGFSYNFLDEQVSAEKIVEELPEILKNSVCIYSMKDIINKETDLSTANNEYMNIKEYDDWKKIKNKKMKENLITNFCLKMKKKYKFNNQRSKQLYLLIKDGFDYKTQKPDDVEMENGEIINIRGIEYDKLTKFFINTRNIEEVKKEKEEINILDAKWKNYVSTIVKELIKSVA